MSNDRYTAEEIEAGLYHGMPGDREFVLASDYDALAAELAREREAYKQLLLDHENAMAHVENVDAELARVKAESLRVVPVGDPCPVIKIWIGGFFRVGGIVYRMFAGDMTENEIRARELINQYEQGFDGDTIVQPVRIERWEASDE